MALLKATSDLEDLVKCAVCLENFTDRDPRTLFCIHSFCARCLCRTYKAKVQANPSSTGYISCPTCTQTTKLSGGSVFQLKPYFVAKQVSDIISNISRVLPGVGLDSTLLCTRCRQKNDAVSYCFDCKHVMCHNCQFKHNNNVKSHVNIPVDMSNLDRIVCKVHQEFAEDYCTTCSVIACSMCHSITHKDHAFSTFSVTKTSFELGILLEEVDQRTLEHESRMEQCCTIELNLRQHTKETIEGIRTYTSKVIGELIGQSNELVAQLKNSECQLNSDIISSKCAINKNIQELHCINDTYTSQFRPFRDIPGLYLSNILDTDDQPRNLPETPTVPNYEVLEFIANLDIPIGELRLTQKSYPSSVDSWLADTNVAHAVWPLGVAIDNSFTNVWTKIGGQRSVAFLANGNLISIGNDGKLVSMTKAMVAKPLQFPTTELGDISLIAAHWSSSSVAATDCDNESFTVVQQIGLSWQTTKVKLGMTNLLHIIAFTPSGLLLVGSGSWFTMTTFTMFTVSGNKLWSKPLDHMCTSMTVADDGRIIICGASAGGQNEVYVYDEMLTILYKLPHPADKERLVSPRGVCTDHCGNLYVCDRVRAVVCMFSTDGRYVKDIISCLDISVRSNISMVMHQNHLALCTDDCLLLYLRK